MHPVIILSHPSLSANIGACARAMANFGLTELRLVNPLPNWLNNSAKALAAGADNILNSAQHYTSTQQSIHDLQFVYATTVRPRDIVKQVITPKQLAQEIAINKNNKQKSGIIFGGEKSGLNNDEIALAKNIVTIPVNEKFSSINLAQSLIVIAYEIFQNKHFQQCLPIRQDIDEEYAKREEITQLLQHLEHELDNHDYFTTQQRKPIMLRNLQNLFYRTKMTSQEVRTLRGVISSLVK